MISVDSDLYRVHPDWAIQVPGYEHTYSRNQLVLDFSNKEVVAYIKQVLDDLLGNHEIDYIKWDMNRNITSLEMVKPTWKPRCNLMLISWVSMKWFRT